MRGTSGQGVPNRGARRHRTIRRRIAAALAPLPLLVAVPITGVARVSAAIGDTRCVVEPTTSTGTQSGVTAVAVGEQLRVGTEVDLEAGVVYQDILANPDGSTYVASWLGVAPAAGSALVADLSSVGVDDRRRDADVGARV